MFGTEAAIHRGAGGYQIGNSLLLNGSNQGLVRTPASTSNTTLWTFSCWLKDVVPDRSGEIFGATQSSTVRTFFRHNGGKLQVANYISSSYVDDVQTAGVYRDPADWMHLVIVYDTNNANSYDRIRFYVDGSRILDASVANYPSLGYTTGRVNRNEQHHIGRLPIGSTAQSGYIAECCFIDGQALEPTAFGEWNENYPTVWQPRSLDHLDFSGVNSCYLNFADPNDIGKDVSGNANSWTPSNLSSADVVTDTPTNNACTWNPVARSETDISLQDGNRTLLGNSLSSFRGVTGTLSFSSGKFYWEVKANNYNNEQYIYYGVSGISFLSGRPDASYTMTFDGSSTDVWIYTGSSQRIISGYGNIAKGDVIGIAVDMDAKKTWFSQNGVWIEGDPVAGTGESHNITHDTLVPYSTTYQSVDADLITTEADLNYTPPSGFKPLTSANLPEPTVANPKEYFDPIIYTGNGQSGRVIPTQNKVDHIVTKHRTNSGWGWYVSDTLRGPTVNMSWNNSGNDFINTEDIQAFGGVSGYTVGNRGAVNLSDNSYVAYPFTKSPIAGMDIVGYTGDGVSGRTIPHNLGVKPAWMLIKRRSRNGGGWVNYFDVPNMGATKYCMLHDNTAPVVDASMFNNTEPDASVFTVGNGQHTNEDTSTFVAYLFASIPGFSKVFEYTGNGSTDGPFINLGFKPAMVIIKRTSSTGEWTLHDIKRETYNPQQNHLHPDLPNAENANSGFYERDALSNGIKMRNTDAQNNANGSTYVGIAFAENPFGMRGK